jgi:cyclase
VTTHGGRTGTEIDALRWIEEAITRGVGEILLNSMDADGTKEGYDLPMLEDVRAMCSVPIIASGGAGKLQDFSEALKSGADALLAASVFHFGEMTIPDVKQYLDSQGYPMRILRR